MEYKILIVRNRFKKKLNFKKGLEWFAKKTPICVEIESQIDTDFEIGSVEKPYNDTITNVTVWGDDIYAKLRSVVPEGQYHCVVIIPGNDFPGIRPHGFASFKPLYPGTDLIQLFKVNDGGKSLNHEIFHTFFHRLQRQQILVDDPMDSVIINGVVYKYYNNDNLNAVPSNRSIALDRLNAHWLKVSSILVLPPVPPSTSPYKWFSANEVARWKLEPRLWELLDIMREEACTPFIITSGRRTPAENDAVGGKPNSAHLKGLAVDLAIVDNFALMRMISGIIPQRNFIFLEFARKHLHIDIDNSIHGLGQAKVEDDD